MLADFEMGRRISCDFLVRKNMDFGLLRHTTPKISYVGGAISN